MTKKNDPVEIVVPLKIQIATFLKEKTRFLVADYEFKTEYLEYDDDGEVIYDQWVRDDDDRLQIALGKKGQKTGPWSLTSFKPARPKVELIADILVKEDNYVFVRVLFPDYKKEALEISNLILSELKVRPKVSLLRA